MNTLSRVTLAAALLGIYACDSSTSPAAVPLPEDTVASRVPDSSDIGTSPDIAESGDADDLPDTSLTPPDTDSAPGPLCEDVLPSVRQLRLLTRREYHTTIFDLLPALSSETTCESVAECNVASESCIAGQCASDPCDLHTFMLVLAPGVATTVHVAGDFNDWPASVEAGGIPMSYVESLGRWVAKHPLESGQWQYKFVVDGEWIVDPANPQTVDNGVGGLNSVVAVDCAGGASPPSAATGLIDIAAPTAGFPVESRPKGFHFDNHADAGLVTSVHIEAYFEAATALAAAARPGLIAALPCSPTDPAACAATFVESFGRRAFRRPLTADEVARYRTQLLAEDGFADGLEVVVRTMLTSPYFLYRFELGEAGDDGTWSLTGYERASALSYFLWGTMPDEALFTAAANGDLDTPDGMEAQARRLLAAPRAREALGDFAVQWLGLEGIVQADRNATLFPEFSPALADAMLSETRHFFSHVTFNGSGTLDELFTADYAFVNDLLAPVYDLDSVEGSAFVATPSLSVRQAGLLTHASVLTSTSHSDQTSPIRRGLFVRERLLCQDLGVPPANAGGVPEVDSNATTRERFRQHSEDPFCATCHVYIDELGFGFERFDPIGAYRLVENGVAIEPDGNMNDVEGLGTATDAEFSTLAELGTTLAESRAATACFVKHVAHYAWGRFERSEDACALERLEARFTENGESIVELLVDVVRSRSFTERVEKPAAPEAP